MLQFHGHFTHKRKRLIRTSSKYWMLGSMWELSRFSKRFFGNVWKSFNVSRDRSRKFCFGEKRILQDIITVIKLRVKKKSDYFHHNVYFMIKDNLSAIEHGIFFSKFHNIHNDFIICILHGSWQKSLLISSFSKQSIMIFYVLNQFMRHRKYKHIHQHVTCQNKAKTTRTIQTVRIHNLQIAHNNTLCLKMFRKFGKLVVPSCEAIGRRYGDVAPTQQFKLPKGKLENHSVHSKIIP